MSLTTNLEAAREVARQIRLRDKGGAIVLDFIDMQEASNKRKVVNTLKNELRKDKSKTRVYGMSKLGLVQFTRKRSRLSLPQILFDYCPVCEGTGLISSIQDLTSRLEQILLSLPRGRHMKVRAKDYVIDHLKNVEWNKLRKIMRMNRICVDFEPDSSVNYGELILTDVDTGKQYNVGR
jgi:ribonuclease G